MIGTLKSNNKIVPMYPYDCKNRPREEWVYHSQDKNVRWKNVFMPGCQYDKAGSDVRCEGCEK